MQLTSLLFVQIFASLWSTILNGAVGEEMSFLPMPVSSPTSVFAWATSACGGAFALPVIAHGRFSEDGDADSDGRTTNYARNEPRDKGQGYISEQHYAFVGFGAGTLADMQLTSLLFVQVILHAFALMLFLALSGSSTCASLVRALPSRGPAQISTCGTWLDSTRDSTRQAMPLSQHLVLGTAWKAPSSTTSIVPKAIKPPPPLSLPCGLGSFSARVTTNPLHFTMQALFLTSASFFNAPAFKPFPAATTCDIDGKAAWLLPTFFDARSKSYGFATSTEPASIMKALQDRLASGHGENAGSRSPTMRLVFLVQVNHSQGLAPQPCQKQPGEDC
ncbi:uncharacterized protein LOC119160731 isoform X1 [Rhipicephalus microplus]|uniref:uncharacterized protein LOC119160731 isoform X1 n=1 Tax=Rhipicephalus microplus TaxID=6941 RepID=UPI003F6D491A